MYKALTKSAIPYEFLYNPLPPYGRHYVQKKTLNFEMTPNNECFKPKKIFCMSVPFKFPAYIIWVSPNTSQHAGCANVYHISCPDLSTGLTVLGLRVAFWTLVNNPFGSPRSQFDEF